jgi:5-(carboxyamino)imidazole ribonucleotide synthase
MGIVNGKTIGIIGGGQLGKMLIEASRPWNINYVVLENDEKCPANLVASEIIVGKLTDAGKINELAKQCDVITYEIEHINADALEELEHAGKTVIPSSRILKTIQDKGKQKAFYSQHQIPTAKYYPAENQAELLEHLDSLAGEKVVVKQRRGGYDGKGVDIVKKADLRANLWKSPGPCVVEEFQENMTEYSVIVAADTAGNIVTWELIEMYFNPDSNLVEFLFSPAEMPSELEQECRQIALNAIKAFNGPGLFAVELFVTSDSKVLVNEIAPRPHNSGHHTIEGSYTSQFEQLNRILLGLPLGETRMIQPAAMINLVGAENQSGTYRLVCEHELLSMPGVYIHLYNKKEIRPHRKMGHIIVLAANMEELLEKAGRVKEMAVFSVV